MQRRPPALSLLALTLAAVLAVSVAGVGMASSGGFAIAADDDQTVDVPERTVSVEGTDFAVAEVIVVDESETIAVEVTAPNDDTYSVNVYNADEQIVDFSRGDGTETHHFDAAALEGPGSYSLGVVQDGELETIIPLVVSGYDLEAAIPDELATDETVDVEVTATPAGAADAPDRVELVLADAGDETRIAADHDDGETYVATVDGADFEVGAYDAYALALEGDGDEPLPVGVSDRASFTVVEPADDPDGAIAGTATDRETGDPVSGVDVELTAAGETVEATTTDDDGAYAFTAVEPGEYDLEFEAGGYESADEPVTVSPDETTTVDLELEAIADDGGSGIGDGGDEDGDDEDADDEDADDEDADDEGSDDEDADDEDADDEDSDGEDADGEDANGEDADGEDADGEDADDEDADNEDADGEEANGEDADGEDGETDDAMEPTLPDEETSSATDDREDADDDIGIPFAALTVLAIAGALTYALRRR